MRLLKTAGPAVVNALERVRILFDVLGQQVLMDQAEPDLRAHRRKLVRNARQAVTLPGDLGFILGVPGVDEFAVGFAYQDLAGMISIALRTLRREDAQAAAALAAPIQMCDALSRNLPKLPEKLEIMVGHCLAHSRRHFVDVVSSFPDECRYVLESLAEVYGYDAEAEEQELAPEERLRFHQERSRPVMDRLHVWLRAQFEEKKIEPNSGLGSAITINLKMYHDQTPLGRLLSRVKEA